MDTPIEIEAPPVPWYQTRKGKRAIRFALAATVGFVFALVCSRVPAEFQGACRTLARLASLVLGGG